MPKLIPDRIRGADYNRQTLRAVPEAGTTIDEALQPDFWAHVAPKAKVGDIVEVFPEDGNWFFTALVVAASNIHLKLHVIHKAVFHEAAPAKDAPKKNEAPFRVEFKGPKHKWSVIRKDGVYVKEGMDDRETADKWLEDNRKDLV